MSQGLTIITYLGFPTWIIKKENFIVKLLFNLKVLKLVDEYIATPGVKAGSWVYFLETTRFSLTNLINVDDDLRKDRLILGTGSLMRQENLKGKIHPMKYYKVRWYKVLNQQFMLFIDLDKMIESSKFIEARVDL